MEYKNETVDFLKNYKRNLISLSSSVIIANTWSWIYLGRLSLFIWSFHVFEGMLASW